MKSKTFQQIGRDIAALAKTLFKKNAAEATSDGRAFLETTREQISIWTNQLANGEITQRNFESLVRGERDLAKMQALKSAGLAQVAIDTFTRGVIDIIINAALGAI